MDEKKKKRNPSNISRHFSKHLSMLIVKEKHHKISPSITRREEDHTIDEEDHTIDEEYIYQQLIEEIIEALMTLNLF